ncbi:hypothetical protein NDU88_004293 [Pleurodeles waltl]|uniref:Uncharacterized protein n=1 Tax=Pleurodeles waltl TaxID=8319 RepID=A0AAV7W7F2_PLEWA|nr:hypothetical protein NDU88_004293 [Pleurodeles waltl]
MEQYKSGAKRAQEAVIAGTQRHKRRRRSWSCAHRPWLTKLTPTQTEEGKLLPIWAAGSLTEAEVSDGEGARSDQDHVADAHPSDSDSQASTPEDLPRVTPQISEDII